MSLDGVMQAPGRQEEDPSDGFRFGGWCAPFEDEVYDKAVQEELQPAEYLLGRHTFEIWESYWPHHSGFWPGINENTKYVLSSTRHNTDWQNTLFISDLEDIIRIKNSSGPDLHVWGSSQLVHLLLKNELVNHLRIKIHPVLLGNGKKLFDRDIAPAAFTLVNSTLTTTGVFIAHYKRKGSVETGRAGE